MTPEKKEALTKGVVEHIMAGPHWKGVVIAASHNNFSQFRGAMRAATDELSAYLDSDERAFVYLHLWFKLGGRPQTAVSQSSAGLDRVSIAITTLLPLWSAPQQHKKEPEQMSTKDNTSKTVFRTKHEVYGRNVEDMSDDELIQAIQQVEGEIANLESIKAQSLVIQDKISQLKTGLEAIVVILDARK